MNGLKDIRDDIQNIADELAYLIRRKQFSLGGV